LKIIYQFGDFGVAWVLAEVLQDSAQLRGINVTVAVLVEEVERLLELVSLFLG
jgi:hypothetical protein